MPMNEEVIDVLDRCDAYSGLSLIYMERRDYATIRAELTRLTEIADSVDPLVVRLGEVTRKLEKMRAIVAACATEVGAVVSPTCSEQFLADVPLEVRAVRRNAESKLEAANALLRDIKEWDVNAAQGTCLMVPHSLRSRIQAHLSEPRT